MLAAAEARALLANPNLIDIGVRADDARRAKHRDRVTFVRVMDVPLTNEAQRVDTSRTTVL